MAWTSPIVDDFDGALRQAMVSLEELRGLDEQYWIVVAVLSAGHLEMAVGRYGEAQRHVREARDLTEPERFDYAWLAAWSRVQLGTLAVVRGRLEEARPSLEEGLNLSLATHSTRNLTLSLAAFAQLAFKQGKAERAALLAGAVEGLRRRVGLRAWPMLRPGEAELVARVREALGADRFGQVFAAGARLSRQQAVVAVGYRRGVGTRAS